jgi:hypothetical protein
MNERRGGLSVALLLGATRKSGPPDTFDERCRCLAREIGRAWVRRTAKEQLILSGDVKSRRKGNKRGRGSAERCRKPRLR